MVSVILITMAHHIILTGTGHIMAMLTIMDIGMAIIPIIIMIITPEHTGTIMSTMDIEIQFRPIRVTTHAGQWQAIAVIM
jgi:hypothetical protein